MSDAHPRAPDPNPDVTAACGALVRAQALEAQALVVLREARGNVMVAEWELHQARLAQAERQREKVEGKVQ